MDYSGKQILLFDGVCNLCEGFVQFVLKRNKKANILFASLQSEAGQNILKHFGLPSTELFSLVFVDNNNIFLRSTGALKVSKYLNALWPMFYCFIVFPKFIRDPFYNWVAKNRYKWFGKKNICWLPTPDLNKRFLN